MDPRHPQEVGAIDGIGVEFLERSLGARSTNPEYRRYAAAARAVLATLLPGRDGGLKGRAPTIVDLHARGDHALLRRLFQSLTKWTVGLTMPLALVVIVFARPLMRIFGADFELGWPILIIGTLGQLVNCGVGSVGYLLLMSGHEKRLIRVQMFMALCMIVASAVLVPLWGIYGAAVAAASTNIGINLWNLLEVRKALGILPYNRSYLSLTLPILSTLALVLVLKRMSYAFRHDWLAIGVTLLLAYLIFPAVFLAISGLDADDRLIASALRSRLRGALGPGEGTFDESANSNPGRPLRGD